MKKLLRISWYTILSVILLLLFVNVFTDRNIETEININAPAEEVWATLMDHASYPDWNPFLIQLTGDPDVGSTIQVTIQPPDSEAMDFAPNVLVNTPNKEFRWCGKTGNARHL